MARRRRQQAAQCLPQLRAQARMHCHDPPVALLWHGQPPCAASGPPSHLHRRGLLKAALGQRPEQSGIQPRSIECHFYMLTSTPPREKRLGAG